MLPRLQNRCLASRRISGVLFDFDGTLTKPGALDFPMIRQAIGCPAHGSILTYIDAITDLGAKNRAARVLHEFEQAAALSCEPNDGAEELVVELGRMGVPMGILTRNTRAAVEVALTRFRRICAADFSILIARDDDVAPKPEPHGIYLAAQAMGVPPSELLIVGDYLYEIEAAQRASCLSVLLWPLGEANSRSESVGGHSVGGQGDGALLERAGLIASYTIDRIDEIRDILRLHRPLSQGKVPNDLLGDLIARELGESVVVAPGPGEDVAVVESGDARLLAIKSDPITFVTDRPGAYTVAINANDIATSGATPRWMLTTLLFPIGTLPAQIRLVVDDLSHSAAILGIEVVGGHTEITDAVTRPVISGSIVGTVTEDRLLRKDDVRAGDRILMTKAAGLEGTAILASASRDRLISAGLSAELLREADEYAGALSILPEARVAGSHSATRCLHDVTEGGVATALEELAPASGHVVHVNLEAIPVLEPTLRVTQVLGVSPMGLIGSGSLLICVAEEGAKTLLSRLESEGIEATDIGWIGDPCRGPDKPCLRAYRNGSIVEWHHFETDELARYLQSTGQASGG